MISSLDMTAEGDKMHLRLLNNKLDIDNKYGSRTKPLRDGMGITATEFREYLSDLSYSMNYFKNWLNDKHFPDGVHFPFDTSEFHIKSAF